MEGDREKIEKLKEIIRNELPDHKLIFEKPLTKGAIGGFHPKEKIIRIDPDFSEDERVIAHEIAHAIEFKRKGTTSHRDRFFWEMMEHKLGVPLITKSSSGHTTLRALEFKTREEVNQTAPKVTEKQMVSFSALLEKKIKKMNKGFG